MGWLYGWRERRDLVNHVTTGSPRKFYKAGELARRSAFYTTEVLARFCSGNDVWAVFKNTIEYAESEDSPVTETVEKKFIVLFMVRGGRGSWGYKDVSESMGPYSYSCPLKFLDMVPQADGEYAAGWREKVRSYWAKKNVKLTIGARVILKDSCKPNRLTVTSVKPLMGRSDNGTTFRIPRRYIEGVEKREATTV